MGSKAAIFMELIATWQRQGDGNYIDFLMIFPELMQTCNRILLMRDGEEMAKEFRREEI